MDNAAETAALVAKDAVRITGDKRKRFHGDSALLESWVKDTLRSNAIDTVANADAATQQAAMVAMLRANGLTDSQIESVIASAGFGDQESETGNDAS